MFQANALGIFGLVAVAMCWALALLLYRVSPTGSVARKLAPLQRFAESIAGVAMPNTQNTPEYAAFRKMQVYEEAVTDARFEGGVSQRERALLVRLRDSLGISASDAETIENELLSQLAPVG